jgi:hypothetical protein
MLQSLNFTQENLPFSQVGAFGRRYLQSWKNSLFHNRYNNLYADIKVNPAIMEWQEKFA